MDPSLGVDPSVGRTPTECDGRTGNPLYSSPHPDPIMIMITHPMMKNRK